MKIRKLKKALRKFENASTFLHEHIYEILESENCYEQVSNYSGISTNQLKRKITEGTCNVIDFIYIIDFFNKKQYEKN